MRLFRFALLVCAVAFASLPSFAQSVDTAGLEVDVHDPSGALVAGATLTLTSTVSHDVRTGVTDAKGRYRFAEVPPGDYVLIATKNGFAEIKQTGITLVVGQAAVSSIAMTVASSDTVVQVNSNVSAIDPDQTTVGQVIAQEEIDNLPSNGRNFLDFVTTVPGVTTTQTTGQNSGFSVNGQRSRSNSIMIDGVENNGQLNGNVRQTLSQDAIAQFQVLTEQFPAEFGGAGGGFINVVTKAGTDNIHGSAYYFVRNDWLNTPNYFSTVTPNTYWRNDVGMSIGGPIKQDRTYYFGALEYIGFNTSRSSSIAGYAAGINPVLQSGVYINEPTTSIDTDSYIPESSAQTLASLRIDHRINDRNTIVARVLWVQYIQANMTDVGSVYDFSTATSTYTHTQNYFTEWTHIFSPTLINEAHFMVAPQRLRQVANNSTGTGADIAGVVIIGSTSDFPVTLNEDHYEADDALSKTIGNHLFKAGIQLNYIRAYSYFPTDFTGSWNFYSTTNFENTTGCPTGYKYCPIPYRFTQDFGHNDIHLPDALIGAYLEDSWKAAARLTLNIGVRYDLDVAPQGFNQNLSDPMQADLSKGMPRDYNNFAPRLGLSFALDKRGKTVLRAGYGMFYDKNILILARNTLQTQKKLILNYNNSTEAALNAQFIAGPLPQSTNYPSVPASVTPPSTIAPTISVAFPGLVLPIVHQADFGIDRALTSTLVLSVTGLHVAGEKLLKAANANLAPPILLTPQNQGTFGFNPTYVAGGTCVSTSSINNGNGGRVNYQPCFQQYRPTYANITNNNVITRNSRLNPAYNDINVTGPWGHSNYNALRVALQQQAWHGLTARASFVWSRAEDDAPDFLNGFLPDNPYNPRAEASLSNEDVRNRFTGALVYRVPFRSKHLWAREAFSGWIFSGTLIQGSGSPENILIGSDINYDDGSEDRPIVNGQIDGPSVGRNTFRGGRQSSASLRGQKELRFPRGQKLVLSAEAFNAFAHLNITSYNTTWGTGAAPASTFGVPYSASDSRTLQLGARYTF